MLQAEIQRMFTLPLHLMKDVLKPRTPIYFFVFFYVTFFIKSRQKIQARQKSETVTTTVKPDLVCHLVSARLII